MIIYLNKYSQKAILCYLIDKRLFKFVFTKQQIFIYENEMINDVKTPASPLGGVSCLPSQM